MLTNTDRRRPATLVLAVALMVPTAASWASERDRRSSRAREPSRPEGSAVFQLRDGRIEFGHHELARRGWRLDQHQTKRANEPHETTLHVLRDADGKILAGIATTPGSLIKGHQQMITNVFVTGTHAGNVMERTVAKDDVEMTPADRLRTALVFSQLKAFTNVAGVTKIDPDTTMIFVDMSAAPGSLKSNEPVTASTALDALNMALTGRNPITD